MMIKRDGFILVLAVCIISVMSVLVVRTIVKLTVFKALTTVLARREQAKLLALSGIELAIAQICKGAPEQKKQNTTTQASQDHTREQLFEARKLCTILNRWQHLSCTEEHEHVEGLCTFYIACEEGKINLNTLRKSKQADTPWDKDLLSLNNVINTYIRKQKPEFDLLKVIDTFLKQNNYQFNDVSELLAHDSLKTFEQQLFLHPQDQFALFDLFAIEGTTGPELRVCGLSKSLATMLNLTLQPPPTEERWTKFLNTIKQPQTTKSSIINAQLELLYGTTQSALPSNLLSLFSGKFDPYHFSVISYGTYSGITVMLYATVQKKEITQKDGKRKAFGCIKRMYWIYE